MKYAFASLALAFAALSSLNAGEPAGAPDTAAVPAAVVSAFHDTYPTATLQSTGVRKLGSRNYYEIKSLDGSTQRDVLYLADGNVAEVLSPATPSDLPSPDMGQLPAPVLQKVYGYWN